MRQMALEMSVVAECAATQCAYNINEQCHAKAITVGGETLAECATFFPAPRHTEDTGQLAGIGACRVTSCRYNRELECAAEKIQVVMQGSTAACATFTPGR